MWISFRLTHNFRWKIHRIHSCCNIKVHGWYIPYSPLSDCSIKINDFQISVIEYLFLVLDRHKDEGLHREKGKRGQSHTVSGRQRELCQCENDRLCIEISVVGEINVDMGGCHRFIKQRYETPSLSYFVYLAKQEGKQCVISFMI